MDPFISARITVTTACPKYYRKRGVFCRAHLPVMCPNCIAREVNAYDVRFIPPVYTYTVVHRLLIWRTSSVIHFLLFPEGRSLYYRVVPAGQGFLGDMKFE